MSETVLRQLLQDARGHSCEYGDALSNHLPMALVALYRLGGADEQLEGFTRLYERRLVQKAPRRKETFGSVDWEEALGKHGCEVELVNFFNAEIEARGAAATLHQYVPVLMPGVAGAAFHGIIRLAYAIDVDDPLELAEGLAAWSMAYLSLDGASEPPRFATPEESLAALRKDPAFASFRPEGSTIFARLESVSRHPAFGAYRSCLDCDAITLAALARASLAIYAATGDFTALHMVTGCHAMRLVLPFVDDQAAALRHMWTAILAAYVSIGRPEWAQNVSRERLSLSVPDWEEIAERTVSSRDDHTIKLVYTCREEWKAYGWPAYQAVAAMKAGF